VHEQFFDQRQKRLRIELPERRGMCGSAECEAKIKEETRATIRVMPMGEPIEAECVYTGQKGREVYFAQAY
jgi:prolyl-tRNA synthetase